MITTWFGRFFGTGSRLPEMDNDLTDLPNNVCQWLCLTFVNEFLHSDQEIIIFEPYACLFNNQYSSLVGVFRLFKIIYLAIV